MSRETVWKHLKRKKNKKNFQKVFDYKKCSYLCNPIWKEALKVEFYDKNNTSKSIEKKQVIEMLRGVYKEFIDIIDRENRVYDYLIMVIYYDRKYEFKGLDI